MKKHIALFIIITLLLPHITGIMAFSAGSDDIIKIDTGKKFAEQMIADNFGKTFVIEGTEQLNDGSFGIILPENAISGFYGKIKGVTGKNNIQITKPILSSIAPNFDVIIENIVIKGTETDGTGLITSSSTTGVILNSFLTINPTNSLYIKDVTNYVSVSVESNDGKSYYAGGFIGFLRYIPATFENCVNYGDITSIGATENCAGGILGLGRDLNGGVKFDNCCNYGKISSSAFSAGIYARAYGVYDDISITNSANFGDVEFIGEPQSSVRVAAGIAGTYSKVSNCFNAGNITSNATAGGIVGNNTQKYEVKNCFNIGKVTTNDTTGKFGAGGICGIASNTSCIVSSCYNAGEVSGALSAQIVDNKEYSDDKACVNNYYVIDGAPALSVDTKITFEDLANPELPEGFSEDVWEILPEKLLGNYVKEEIYCTKGYRYPQIKGNWIDHKYKKEYFEYEEYRGETTGKITELTTGWEIIPDVSNGFLIYSSDDNAPKILSSFAYPSIMGSTLIRGNADATSMDVSFNIDGTAEIILAVNTSEVDSLNAVVNDKFEIMVASDNTPLAFVTDNGDIYYLLKKIVEVKPETTETVTIKAEGSISNNFAIFVNWLETYSVTFVKSGAGDVYVNGEIIDETSIPFTSGSTLDLKVVPAVDNYIKNITLNGEVNKENCVIDFEEKYKVNKNLDFVIEMSEYLFIDSDTSDNILPPDIKLSPYKGNDGLLKQSIIITGDLEEFLNGAKVTAILSKDDEDVLSDYKNVSDGKIEITLLLPSTVVGIHNIRIEIEIPNGNDVIKAKIPLDVTKQTIDIATVENINTLITKLNISKEDENSNERYNPEVLTDFILENSDSLSLDIDVFKETSLEIQTLISNALINDYNNFDIDNIEDRFNDEVIMKVVNNSQSTNDYENIIKFYEQKIEFSKSPIYSEYASIANKDSLAYIMKSNSYSNYDEIRDAFEYGLIYDKLSSVDSYDNIIDVLESYTSVSGLDLGITSAQISEIKGMTTESFKVIAEEIGTNLKDLKTKALLSAKVTYCKEHVSELLENKTSDTVVIPSYSGSGGGGGGGKISVEKDYTQNENTEENSTVPVTDAISDFDDLGDTPWAQESIRSLLTKGIIRGKETGKFYPTDKVTRAEFVKMIVLAFNLMKQNPQCYFEDLPTTHWSYNYVASAFEAGVISGYSKDEFGVNSYITRQDMAAILIRIIYRFSLYEKMEQRAVQTSVFSDIDSVADYAKGGVKMFGNAGIISGYEDGTFGPERDLTRAEAAAILSRILEFFEI